MFQGMARGSVGDVVFYRLDGKQIARVRNRNPKNPKSQGQIAQRAIMATIMQAYSHGKEIFDHSFEGKSVGMGSMREFLSRNANALRQAIIYDFGVKPTTHLNGMVNAPKTNTPVPNQYVISAGSLEQNFFNIQEATATNQNAVVTTPAALEGETMSEYAARVGLHVGDIYTIVGFALRPTSTVFSTPNGIGAGAYQEKGQFYYVRLIVTDGINSDSPVTSVKMNDIFEEVATQGIDTLAGFTSPVANYNMNLGLIAHFAEEEWIAVSAGIIRSEVNSGLRSNETMHWCKFGNVYGIDYRNLWLAWDKTKDELGQSDLILEGGGFTPESLSDNSPVEISAEGNYLVAVKADGTKAVLTSEGQAVMLNGGRLQIAIVGTANSSVGFEDTGNYQGSLPQQAVTISQEGATQGSTSQYETTIVLTTGGVTFKTDRKVFNANTMGGQLFDISLGDFKISY